jgi:RNA polymerase sigma factor (sigma-70 family)
MALSRVPASRKGETSARTASDPLDRATVDSLSDSTLHILERAQAGDEQAATILVERALPPVRRWARGRLPRYARSDADTEDVVQDVFLRTLRGIKRFQHRTVGGLQAYLRQAVVNRIRDLIRGSKRRGSDAGLEPEPRDWKPTPLEAAIMRQQLDEFLVALRTLRPADRQVIVWRIELGYTVEEIAVKLGKSKPAAGMTVTRAMTRLARQLRLEIDPSD